MTNAMLPSTVPTFNSCTKCLVRPGIIHDRTPNFHPVSWRWMHVRLNVVLVRKLLCAWFIFETLSISVCTTSHRQKSGQLVQELNVCTVRRSQGFRYSMDQLFVYSVWEMGIRGKLCRLLYRCYCCRECHLMCKSTI